MYFVFYIWNCTWFSGRRVPPKTLNRIRSQMLYVYSNQFGNIFTKVLGVSLNRYINFIYKYIVLDLCIVYLYVLCNFCYNLGLVKLQYTNLIRNYFFHQIWISLWYYQYKYNIHIIVKELHEFDLLSDVSYHGWMFRCL